MISSTKKLLTIITESDLERIMVKEIERQGETGFTIINARGKGSREQRNAAWDERSNIRMEVVCGDATPKAIADHLQTRYYLRYGMILFMSDVAVLPPERF